MPHCKRLQCIHARESFLCNRNLQCTDACVCQDADQNQNRQFRLGEKMKLDQIRNKNRDELITLLDKTRSELVELRFQVAIHKIQNHTDIRKKKQQIARILTILNQSTEV